MTGRKQKKSKLRGDNFVITFHFPPSREPPVLRGEAARVVGEFIGTLDTESSARTVALEVSAERIKIHRRAGRTPAPGAFMVPLDGLLGIAKERFLAVALNQETVHRHLWTIVDAARGHEEINSGDINLAIGQIGVAVGTIAFKENG